MSKNINESIASAGLDKGSTQRGITKTLEERVVEAQDFLDLCYTENEQELLARLKITMQLIKDQQARINELEAPATEAEIEAVGKAIQKRYWCGDLEISINESRKVCMEFAKAALEAAAKVRGK